MPLARIARERGALTSSGVAAVERVCARLDRLAGPAEPPARLHGDLWSGNVHADTDGRPWLIDPSAYGGHREVDLAMLRLFGAPSECVFAAYEELAPLADGWRERVSSVAARAAARARGAVRWLLLRCCRSGSLSATPAEARLRERARQAEYKTVLGPVSGLDEPVG